MMQDVLLAEVEMNIYNYIILYIWSLP